VRPYGPAASARFPQVTTGLTDIQGRVDQLDIVDHVEAPVEAVTENSGAAGASKTALT
jgi:hypothetical protein